MRNGVIKKGIGALLLALPLCSLAETINNPDLIAGYTSQELAAALPAKVSDMAQRGVVVDDQSHSLQSEYIDSIGVRKALVTLYTLPVDKSGKVPEASQYRDLAAVIATAEKEMIRQRIRPDKREVPVDGTSTFRCLQTILNNRVLHSLCYALVKGRVLEIQAVNTLENVQDRASTQIVINQQNTLVVEIGKTMLTLKK
ncbi:hypothetical protein [Brenneria rubrifaciens]|uniref:Uncharacterized protein n=1 Tax=Brenneria rubrifaciens TaxID=55213 RepID=A0A4P8QYX4_9GAMM|nr:hypothetical protein [Brenneria rubrifaciens]QCR08584.1 hypothetical protein EH207_08640 [Brenneria rubrifaciens]